MGDRTTRFRSALTLRLTGEVTRGTAARVLTEAEAAVAASTSAVLVLDLRELESLTADGVRPLLLLAGRCTERGIRCAAVVNPGSAVGRVLDEVGAGTVLPRFPDLDQALAAHAVLKVPREPVDFDVLSQQLEMLTRELLGSRTVGAALQQVVDTTARVMPAADLVSVTLRSPRGEVFTPVRTGAVAAELDLAQYRAGAGPCVDAADPAGPAFAVSTDLTAERRWPDFAALAVTHGYRGVIATGLLPGDGPGRVTGALNIYARDGHGLDESDRHAALLLATHAALAVAHARGAELADLHEAELRRAIDSRDVIGQAKGILMQRQGISADQAFDLLRTTSQDINVKLVDVARNLVARHRDLGR